MVVMMVAAGLLTRVTLEDLAVRCCGSILVRGSGLGLSGVLGCLFLFLLPLLLVLLGLLLGLLVGLGLVLGLLFLALFLLRKLLFAQLARRGRTLPVRRIRGLGRLLLLGPRAAKRPALGRRLVLGPVLGSAVRGGLFGRCSGRRCSSGLLGRVFLARVVLVLAIGGSGLALLRLRGHGRRGLACLLCPALRSRVVVVVVVFRSRLACRIVVARVVGRCVLALSFGLRRVGGVCVVVGLFRAALVRVRLVVRVVIVAFFLCGLAGLGFVLGLGQHNVWQADEIVGEELFGADEIGHYEIAVGVLVERRGAVHAFFEGCHDGVGIGELGLRRGALGDAEALHGALDRLGVLCDDVDHFLFWVFFLLHSTLGCRGLAFLCGKRDIFVVDAVFHKLSV
eukprot:comp20411_c0_seq3/m.40941 comp20411_c0_seq3/g.40941  ORF comp20411_c0_seq3/g.40941 comp20411_c0_seq3/m.40941 type:complete len:395 (-) comp20411_c0_seq3:918-2102(-)